MRWAPQAPGRAAPYHGWPRGRSGGLPQLQTLSQLTEVALALQAMCVWGAPCGGWGQPEAPRSAC